MSPASCHAKTIALRLDDLPDGIVVTDRSGRVEEANRVFLSQIDRPSEDVCQRPLLELVAREDILHLAGFDAMFGAETLQDVSVIFTAPDGSWRPLVVSSARARDSAHLLITTRVAGVVHRELTDASRSVAREHERSLSLSAARDALTVKNEALYAARVDIERAYTKLQREVAARERLERELELARRLEAIGQLSAGVAHEINGPLQYVGDSVHFLTQAFQRLSAYVEGMERLMGQATPPVWDEAQAAAEVERKQARLGYILDEIPRALHASTDGLDHVGKIVQALKAFSHQAPEGTAAGDLNAAIRSTLIMASHQYKRVASVQTELGELPPVVCVMGQVRQVLLNLVVNAAHAIVDARRDGLGLITVVSLARGDVVEVRVADTGCGIPEHIRDKIFEPFFTTKEVGRGTGQGLALARQIVEGHGGTLTFSSEVGRGTTFTLELPIDGVPLAPASAGDGN